MSDGASVWLGNAGLHYFEVKTIQDPVLQQQLRDGFLEGARRIPVPKGALLIWNSRTIHQGHGGGGKLAVLSPSGCVPFSPHVLLDGPQAAWQCPFALSQ